MSAGDANLTRFRERDRRSALTVTSSDSPGPSPHQPQLPPSLHSTTPTPVHDPHHQYISSDCRSLHLGLVRLISVHTLAHPRSSINTGRPTVAANTAAMPSATGQSWEKYQKNFADDEVEEKKITPLTDE